MRWLTLGMVVILFATWRSCARRGLSDSPDEAPLHLALRGLTVPPIHFDRGDDVWERGGPPPVRLRPPTHVRGEIRAGLALSTALANDGVPPANIGRPVAVLGQVFDFRRSQPGHTYEADLDDTGRIVRLRYQTRPETAWEVRWSSDGGYVAAPVEFPIETRVRTLAAVIEGSFIGAVTAAGERESLAQRFVEVFQWDIDFSRQVHPGDAFRIVFEEVRLGDAFLRYGRVLAAEYRGRAVRVSAFHFEDEQNSGWFTEDGHRLERMFLAAPCRYRRISSRFDPNRLHPVLGVRRPHYGVDYAAPTGTPVHASADGVVTFVGVRGGNGNLVTIRHDHGYESGYAHLHRFARGLRRGDRVRQGQMIGTVGTTGLSTGPHLHYGLKRNGTWIDPLQANETRGPPLNGRSLREFRRRTADLRAQLDAIPMPDVELVPDEPIEEEGEELFVEDFLHDL